MTQTPSIALSFQRQSDDQMRASASQFLETMRTRRSVRHFKTEPVPIDILERCIEAASQAPSGANKQPWTFVLVTNAEVKRQIREAAEVEEAAFYAGRASETWLRDVQPFGTDEHKPFLEDAPALIVVFAQKRGDELGERHYYVNESVGIALGFLLAGLHHAGIATLTHTPAPMKFLSDILGRPANESPYMLIPVGYPSDDCQVPDISRKPLSAVLVKV